MKAVLDTCVLYPSGLRDFLLELVDGQSVDAYWSRRTLDELRFALLAYYDGDREGHEYVLRLIKRIRLVFPFREVEGVAAVPKGECFPDIRDLHVVSAALETGSSAIVTFNLRDFPAMLMPEGIRAVHPDEYLG